jgi:hypothetical protein
VTVNVTNNQSQTTVKLFLILRYPEFCIFIFALNNLSTPLNFLHQYKDKSYQQNLVERNTTSKNETLF